MFMLLLTLACVVQPLPAQFARGERAGLSQSHVTLSRDEAIAAVKQDVGNTYWKEGGIFTSLAGVILANALPRDPSIGDRISGSVIAALIFFWPGALIGKQFPKE
jgi:hypothetical protein